MDSKPTFSLSYEQLKQAAEEEIKKCDLRQDSPLYLQELGRANGVLRLWSNLALSGYPDGNGFEQVYQDRQRLRALLDYPGDNMQ